ncbi:MAG: LacI family DNA-binding transcriptional regulator, partial [Hyphomicrobiaceae bacterium]
MARRPTTADVAREAGVSLTTVDRALNGRVKVREETIRKISEAAHRIGYHGRGLIETRLLDQTVPHKKLGIVLVKRTQEFYQNFECELAAAVAARSDIRGEVVVRYVSSQAPEEFAKVMMELGEKVDALACVAINHQKLSDAVQKLQDRGVPVFALLNDMAQGIRKTYLGLNNMKVGRTAAWTLTKTVQRPGKL